MKNLLITKFKVCEEVPRKGIISCTDYKGVYRVYYTNLIQDNSYYYNVVSQYDYSRVIFAIRYSQIKEILKWPQTEDIPWYIIVVVKNDEEKGDTLYTLGTDYNLYISVVFTDKCSKINCCLKQILMNC